MSERTFREHKINHREMCERMSGKMCAMHGYYRECRQPHMKEEFRIDGVPYQWLCSEPMHHRETKGAYSCDPDLKNMWFCSTHCLHMLKHGTDDMKFLHTRHS